MTNSNSKITLYALRQLHLPVLLPVYHELLSLGYQNIAFSAPPFQEGREGFAEEGLPRKALQELKQKQIPFWEGTPERLDLIITADACYDRIEGWGPVICVGHGTISKNIFFIDSPSCRRENFATALCVPGPFYTQAFGEQVHTHIIPTGFPKMDELSNDQNIAKLKLWARLNWDLNTTTILYAPTYNKELSSLDILLKQWPELKNTQVLFKLHGATLPQQKEEYQKLCETNANFHFVTEQDLAPLMQMADIMVSDYSSAYVEFLTQYKPIILVENQLAQTSNFYNANSVEIQAQAACYCITENTSLSHTIQQIRNSDPLAESRKQWSKKLFPQMDGLNSARVAQVCQDFLQEKRPFLPSGFQEVNIYIPPTFQSLPFIQENILRADFKSKVYSHSPIQLDSLTVLPPNQYPPQPCIILSGEVLLPFAWDRLWNAFRQWNTGPMLTGPSLPSNQACLVQQLHLLIGKNLKGEPDLVQMFCKYQLTGHFVELPSLFMDGLLCSEDISLSVWKECIDLIKQGAGLQEFFGRLPKSTKIGASVGMNGILGYQLGLS